MREHIPYGRHHVDEEDIQAVVEVLRGEYLTTGPYVKRFEDNFAAFVGARYAVSCSSGTAALHLACLAGQIKRGSEIITSPMSFSASANCGLYVGARPVFADIDESTYNINPDEIEKRITKNTRAIIPVHYTGQPCSLKEIKEIAERHNLLVIEDACHALGAEYLDTRIGDCHYSDMAVFSFHPVKHITTGEGGMITTNSKEIYERLITLRTHGIKRDGFVGGKSHGAWYYEMQELGFNYRLTDIQAALGISQLRKLPFFVSRRREIALMYNEAFKGLSLKTPIEPFNSKNSYHLYVIRVKEKSRISRKELYDRLKAQNIYCQVHYIPIHTMPFYQKELGYDWGDYPNAEEHYHRVLSLPIFPQMSNLEVEKVISAVAQAAV